MPNKILVVSELPEDVTPEKVKNVIQQKYNVKVIEMGAVMHKGSITSIQAVYVPADDYVNPVPAITFAQLDAKLALPR